MPNCHDIERANGELGSEIGARAEITPRVPLR